MTNWIDIRDDVPNDGDECLVVTEGRRIVDAHYAIEYLNFAGGFYTKMGTYVYDITHWMPRPELPPPPRPKGPFDGFLKVHPLKGHVTYPRSIRITYHEEKYDLACGPGKISVDGFIDWLNEMWTKNEQTG